MKMHSRLSSFGTGGHRRWARNEWGNLTDVYGQATELTSDGLSPMPGEEVAEAD